MSEIAGWLLYVVIMVAGIAIAAFFIVGAIDLIRAWWRE